jgi:hypothetical protein
MHNPTKKYRWYNRHRCPHTSLRGIYGDEINHTPHFSRLQCHNCYRFLDGPVWLAESRREEYLGLVRILRENERRRNV